MTLLLRSRNFSFIFRKRCNPRTSKSLLNNDTKFRYPGTLFRARNAPSIGRVFLPIETNYGFFSLKTTEHRRRVPKSFITERDGTFYLRMKLRLFRYVPGLV